MNISNYVVTDGYDGVPFLGLLRINWGRYKLFAAPADLIDDDWFHTPYWNVFEMFPDLRKHEIKSSRKFRNMVGWDWHSWVDAADKLAYTNKMPCSKPTKTKWIEEVTTIPNEYEDIWRCIPHCKIIGITYNLKTVEPVPRPYMITSGGERVDKGQL